MKITIFLRVLCHLNQARGNARVSCTEFAYDKRAGARDCKCLLIFELPAYKMFVKNILLQISFYAFTLQVNVRIFSTKFEG